MEQERMMYCANCGKELGEGARFCGGCGTPVVDESGSAAEPIVSDVAASPVGEVPAAESNQSTANVVSSAPSDDAAAWSAAKDVAQFTANGPEATRTISNVLTAARPAPDVSGAQKPTTGAAYTSAVGSKSKGVISDIKEALQ